jgi:hypothetical protein
MSTVSTGRAGELETIELGKRPVLRDGLGRTGEDHAGVHTHESPAQALRQGEGKPVWGWGWRERENALAEEGS